MDELMLSIYVTVYNHEKYIRKAVESILMQKTQYRYEVWIGEDCSTDNTRAVLKEIEKDLPDHFHILYREHNMNKEKIRNGGDLKRRCKGKYIIALEGDDYWIDDRKIEKQISFLENNRDFIAVAHDCIVVGDEGQLIDESYPTCHKDVYSFREFASEIMPGQLCTVMYRNPYVDTDPEDVRYFSRPNKKPGDRATFFWLLCKGKIRCLQEKMSAYRFVTSHGTSWSANFKYKFRDWDNLYRAFVDYAYEINNREGIKTAEFLLLKNLLKGYKEKQCELKEMLSEWRKMKHRAAPFMLYIKYRINRNLLKKEEWI